MSNIATIFAAFGFVAGFSLGFIRPKRYCHQSTEQSKAFGNRLGSGLINGCVMAGISAAIGYVLSVNL